MTILSIETRNSGAGHWIRRSLSTMLEWFGAVFARSGGMPATALDELSEAQLEDLGMTRIAHGARWLDCREPPRYMDFEYVGDHR